jgi:hypothetical protein
MLYEKSFLEQLIYHAGSKYVDGMDYEEGDEGDEEDERKRENKTYGGHAEQYTYGGRTVAGCGFPFMHNLSIPLGLVLRPYMSTVTETPSKCAGFMCESDYEKATSGTHMNKRNKKTRRNNGVSTKITRKKKQ